jgi:hypothetical protein
MPMTSDNKLRYTMLLLLYIYTCTFIPMKDIWYNTCTDRRPYTLLAGSFTLTPWDYPNKMLFEHFLDNCVLCVHENKNVRLPDANNANPDSGKTPAQNSCMFLQESSQDNSLNMYEVCGRGNLWRIDWTTKHLKYVKYVANIIDTVIATRDSATICSLATILWRHLVTSCADKGGIWPSDHLITWGERLFQASQSKLCLYHQR